MSDSARFDLDALPWATARLAKAASRPRAAAIVCVLALSGLGWLVLAGLQAQSSLMSAICGPLSIGAGIRECLAVFAMWAAMILAMMLPAASATILTYAEIADTAARKGIHVVSPFVLTAGYVWVWLGFALAATAVQVALARAALLDPVAVSLAPSAAGALFIAAGLYQFSALKQACLRQCRNPFTFFFTNWATTTRGVLRLGVKQGLFCLGCCWAAMLLMFALGVMNIVWMVVLAMAMTAEKLVHSRSLSRIFGGVLIVLGVFFISGAGI